MVRVIILSGDLPVLNGEAGDLSPSEVLLDAEASDRRAPDGAPHH